MATLAQLQAEPWWGNEFAPPSLANLRNRLLTRWRLSGGAIGIKGDEWHLAGYHRSRDWIHNSRYCVNRTYSVSRTGGDRAGGDPRWLAALDISLPTAQLLQVCQRLDQAVRAGRLEKVTEWYGNVNGDRIVDGYDNIANRVALSDDSHLWHLHISFDRGRVGEDHTDLYEILTGDDDMTPEELFNAPVAGTTDNPGRTYRQTVVDGWYNGHIRIPAALAEVKGMLVEIGKRVDISDAELAAIGEQAAAAVDEQAIAEGVLAGLGAKSPEDVAAALRAVMTPEQARAVGAILATAE